MIKKIAKVALILTFIIFTASAVSAQTQTDTNCTTSPDYGVGRTTNCTSTSTPTGPTAAQVEQQKQLNQNMSQLGGAIGMAIARKRAANDREKSDIAGVMFCRLHPVNGTWKFDGKNPQPCSAVEDNVLVYCATNRKKQFCKDYAKLAPTPANAVTASAPVVTAQPTQRQPLSADEQARLDETYCRMHSAEEIAATSERTQAACKALATPVVVPVVQPAVQQPAAQPAPEAQPQPQRIDELPTSVAEAARQARIAKAVREAKEKAERDNPAPPQQ